MTEAIIVGVIAGLASVASAIVSALSTTSKLQQKLDISDAVQNERIQELTREVRLHNHFAEQIPRLEMRIEYLEKELKK